jgi:hypothetical protein
MTTKKTLRKTGAIAGLSLFVNAICPQGAEAKVCAISSDLARHRIQLVNELIERGTVQIRSEERMIQRLRSRTEDLDDAVSAGRYAFSVSMAAGTVLSGGVTAACVGSAMSSGVGFSTFLGQLMSSAAAVVSAPITAGMAYGTYRTLLAAGHPRGNTPESSPPSVSDRESDARAFLRLILDPSEASESSISREFSDRRYDSVRSFLTSESCSSISLCNPVPPDFADQRSLVERAHRESAAQFERENSDLWPEVISNYEARRLATVETPYHEGLVEQLEQTQAYLRLVADALQPCVD